ncbi:hypothetical protein GSI_11798 [Ganoderma sinense ZZ0214-1]|uniref:Transporter n=1 Tax=Ganoderma sinense ZZ0214-1 TaxID=1077348 RepID=A0A2G8RX32_9APHY|nr:hypothetical protein GSI_11798 [Ganoderma sinense ZZ0214-1]
MFPKVLPSLVVLFALCGSYSAPDDGVSSVLSGIGFRGGFKIPVVTRTVGVATAADATLSPAATLVEGSTDAHLFGVVTVGSEVVTFNEDCGLNNDSAICTLVAKNATATLTSMVTTITPCTGSAWPCPSIFTTGSPTSRNGAGRMRFGFGLHAGEGESQGRSAAERRG